jgi:hypothetical protein
LKLIGHIWSLPNTLIGLLFGIGGRFSIDRVSRVFVVHGGWMAGIFGRFGFVGMCVGDVVLCAQRLSAATYRHELVHATQARIFGPLYLPLTLLGYLWGYLIFPQNGHDASPLEVWADLASGNSTQNAYLRARQASK